MAKWLPPYGFTCKVHHMDAKVGGTYKMSFTNFTTGQGHSFGGEYRRAGAVRAIRYTDKFDDPNLPGEMQTTVTLKQVSCGTELNIVQEGLPEVIPARDVLPRLAGVARAARARSSSPRFPASRVQVPRGGVMAIRSGRSLVSSLGRREAPLSPGIPAAPMRRHFIATAGGKS